MDALDPFNERDESRRGEPVMTASGRAYYPLDPRASEVEVGDVVWSLSRLPRWNGHARRASTVIEHLCRCHDLAIWRGGFDDGYVFAVAMRDVKPTADQVGHLFLAAMCLVHDGGEAYLCDLPPQVKRGVPDYVALEHVNDAVVAAGLLGHLVHEAADHGVAHAMVKRVDEDALGAEARALMPRTWAGLADPPQCQALDAGLPPWDERDEATCWQDRLDMEVAQATVAAMRVAVHGRSPHADRTERLLRAEAAAQAKSERFYAARLGAAWLRRYDLIRAACEVACG